MVIMMSRVSNERGVFRPNSDSCHARPLYQLMMVVGCCWIDIYYRAPGRPTTKQPEAETKAITSRAIVIISAARVGPMYGQLP